MKTDPKLGAAATLQETPMIRDLRQLARDLGVVSLLVEHQQVTEAVVTRTAYRLVEEALILLGEHRA